MVSYFRATEPPSEPLLRLKLRELILGILVSRVNPALASYLRSVADSHGPSVRAIMEENFRYNLSLPEFAQLCHRSLSSFKRDFATEYGEPPGRWLLTRRLDYAAVLLRNNGMNVSQVVFESGFEDLSHFSRAFKERFGVPPTQFRGPSAVKH
jgi:AraC-like DNA-binding protein